MGESKDSYGWMERLEFGWWVVRYDPEATRRAHTVTSSGAPEDCSCVECCNFAVALPLVYTATVPGFLNPEEGGRVDRELPRLPSG